jgi:hypothetical protein
MITIVISECPFGCNNDTPTVHDISIKSGKTNHTVGRVTVQFYQYQIKTLLVILEGAKFKAG